MFYLFIRYAKVVIYNIKTNEYKYLIYSKCYRIELFKAINFVLNARCIIFAC